MGPKSRGATHCRVCGKRVKEHPYPKSQFVSELKDLFAISVDTESSELPVWICMKCRGFCHRKRQADKAGKLFQPTKLPVPHTFTLSTSEDDPRDNTANKEGDLAGPECKTAPQGLADESQSQAGDHAGPECETATQGHADESQSQAVKMEIDSSETETAETDTAESEIDTAEREIGKLHPSKYLPSFVSSEHPYSSSETESATESDEPHTRRDDASAHRSKPKRKREKAAAARTLLVPPHTRDLQSYACDSFEIPKLAEVFICGICRRIPKTPHSTGCHHVYCAGCIRTWLKSLPVCPGCKDITFEEDAKPLSGRLREIYDTLKLECRCGSLVNINVFEGHSCRCADGVKHLKRGYTKRPLCDIKAKSGRHIRLKSLRETVNKFCSEQNEDKTDVLFFLLKDHLFLEGDARYKDVDNLWMRVKPNV